MHARRSFLLLFLRASPAFSAVDLVTLPTREGTQLTIYERSNLPRNTERQPSQVSQDE